MIKAINNIQKNLTRIPTSAYLVIAVLIFAASNSVTRKLINIGKYHLINGQNPISSCNVLFVGNLCALGLMFVIFHQDCKRSTLKVLSLKNWISLTIISILSGAIAPWLIFTALEQTNVTNIVLIGRIEPILSLIWGVWLLGSKVNFWTIAGSIISFLGVVLTALLASSGQMIAMGGFHLGIGEFFVAIAAIISSLSNIIGKLQLKSIPLGIFMIYRNILGTVIFFLLANFIYGLNHFGNVFSSFLWQWMLIYGAIIVVIGQLCWFVGLKNATSTELNITSLLNPIVAIFMAYLILGEIPTTAQYLGGSFLLLGVILSFVGNLYQRKTNGELMKSNPHKFIDIAMGFRGI